MIIRCFPSVLVARAEGALCHVGLADRNEPEDCWGTLGDRNGDAVRWIGATSGASLTYGNRFGSRRLRCWSYPISSKPNCATKLTYLKYHVDDRLESR
jgi:hypothetical protein